MKNKDTLINEVKKIDLPLGKYTVVGGGVLAVRGIRDTQDIDLIVTEDFYEKLKNNGWVEKEKGLNNFHLYKDDFEVAKDFSHIDGCKLDSKDVIKNSDIIEDVPFMSLKDLLELKKALGREKDIKDIELINKYLSTNFNN
jgi:hypothetical protein